MSAYRSPRELAEYLYQTPITGAAALEKAIAAGYISLLDEIERRAALVEGEPNEAFLLYEAFGQMHQELKQAAERGE